MDVLSARTQPSCGLASSRQRTGALMSTMPWVASAKGSTLALTTTVNTTLRSKRIIVTVNTYLNGKGLIIKILNVVEGQVIGLIRNKWRPA